LRNFELELELRNLELELELRNFDLKFPTKQLHPKINIPFYNVNIYMWCYQYTGTIMIQNFIYISDMHTYCGTPSEHLATLTPPHSILVIYIEILLFRTYHLTGNANWRQSLPLLSSNCDYYSLSPDLTV